VLLYGAGKIKGSERETWRRAGGKVQKKHGVKARSRWLGSLRRAGRCRACRCGWSAALELCI
jgi:hypothetical protein